jgi:pimeloyl-ACP methyl ester carboxylesterase
MHISKSVFASKRMAIREPPAWFKEALGHCPPTHHFVKPDGVKIHYLRYSRRENFRYSNNDRPALLFVHGGFAHARWWDFIAPFFVDRYNCIAMDCAGHGDSDHLDAYSMDTDLAHALAVLQDAGALPQPSSSSIARPVIIGHSRGGFVAMHMAKMVGEQLGGVIILDSFVMPPEKVARPPPTNPKQKWYAAKGELVDRFSLRPPQDCDNRYLMDYIAEQSVLEDSRKGFTWKFDKALIQKAPQYENPEYPMIQSKRLQGLKCRAQFFYGTSSFFFADPAVREYMQKELDEHPPGGEPSQLVAIVGAAHHVMADQPVGVISAVSTALAQRSGQLGAVAKGLRGYRYSGMCRRPRYRYRHRHLYGSAP